MTAPSHGPLWDRMDAQPRFRAAELARADVPTDPGVYAWYGRGRAVYVGKADSLRDRAGCCWGDETIDAMADGRVAFKSQQKMRALATCHHIATLAAERETVSRRSRVEGLRGKDWSAAVQSAIGRDDRSGDATTHPRRG